jgi:hypothetical protein
MQNHKDMSYKELQSILMNSPEDKASLHMQQHMHAAVSSSARKLPAADGKPSV